MEKVTKFGVQYTVLGTLPPNKNMCSIRKLATPTSESESHLRAVNGHHDRRSTSSRAQAFHPDIPPRPAGGRSGVPGPSAGRLRKPNHKPPETLNAQPLNP